MMIFGDDLGNGDSNQVRPYYKSKSQSSKLSHRQMCYFDICKTQLQK